MFERELFRIEFPEHVRRYAEERNLTSVRVVVVTVTGDQFEIQTLRAGDRGLRLYTKAMRWLSCGMNT